MLENALHILRESSFTVALTGAGISVDSGIPDFRSPGGLWERFDPMEYAHIESFLSKPAKVWKMLLELYKTVADAKPNPGHSALATMEHMGYLKAVITQNIDNLHQVAGSREVVEFHGNYSGLVCLQCQHEYVHQEISMELLPPHCECGGLLKPQVVFFGEMIPLDALTRSMALAEQAEAILVVGTSAMVAPASNIPLIVGQHGGKIIEVNLEETVLSPLATVSLIGSASEILPRLAQALRH